MASTDGRSARRDGRRADDEGFTLIELLVVVIIIGILAAIAIPVYLNQREKAWEARAKTDIRNMATSEFAYNDDNDAYADAVADLDDAGFRSSADDDMIHGVCRIVENGQDSFIVAARHQASATTWLLDGRTMVIEESSETDVATALENAASDSDGGSCDAPTPDTL